jgi:hypothetical protein
MAAQPLNRVIRGFLAQMVAAGAPPLLDEPFSPAGFRMVLARKRTRGNEDLLAPFAVRAPASVTHYLWSSSVICADLPMEDRDIVRDEIETILYRYLNPLDVVKGANRTLWLLSESEQSQLVKVMSMSPDAELGYLFATGPTAQWTGPVRGLHKAMAALAQVLSRHPDFVTGKAICRAPTTLLFLAESRGLDKVSTAGIGVDGRSVPGRGVFAIDTSSYMDALVQFGEDAARDLAAVEFSFAGTCIRAHGPLGIPLYRVPHAILASNVRSIILVDGNRAIYEAPAGGLP